MNAAEEDVVPDSEEEGRDNPHFPTEVVLVVEYLVWKVVFDAEQENAEDEIVQEEEIDHLEVGDTVMVAQRTWPGVNKLGGAGRISKVTIETDDEGNLLVLYDIRYLLGGSERFVEEEYVEGTDLVRGSGSSRKKKARVFYHDEYLLPGPGSEPHTIRRVSTKAPNDGGDSNTGLYGAQRRRRSTPVEPLDTRSDQTSPITPQKRHPRSVPRSERRRTAPAPAMLDSESEELIPHTSQLRKRRSVPRPRIDDSESEDLSSKTGPAIDILDTSDSDEPSSGMRTIDSDQMSLESEHSQPELQHQSPLTFGMDENEPVLNSMSPSRQRSRKRRKKKNAEYVGGYVHAGEDPDAMFIQPEDDAMDLPQDVANETGFVPASSVSGLTAQLKDQQEKFDTNYEKISARFNEFEAKYNSDQNRYMKKDIGRDEYKTILCDLDAQYDGIDASHRSELVRFGIDVLDLLVRKLDKKLDKKGRTMDESIDFKFDAQKRQENELAERIRRLGLTLSDECESFGIIKKEPLPVLLSDPESFDDTGGLISTSRKRKSPKKQRKKPKGKRRVGESRTDRVRSSGGTTSTTSKRGQPIEDYIENNIESYVDDVVEMMQVEQEEEVLIGTIVCGVDSFGLSFKKSESFELQLQELISRSELEGPPVYTECSSEQVIAKFVELVLAYDAQSEQECHSHLVTLLRIAIDGLQGCTAREQYDIQLIYYKEMQTVCERLGDIYTELALRIHWYFLQLIVVLHCPRISWDESLNDLQFSDRSYEHTTEETAPLMKRYYPSEYCGLVMRLLFKMLYHQPSTYQALDSPVHSLWNLIFATVQDVTPQLHWISPVPTVWGLLRQLRVHVYTESSVEDDNTSTLNAKAVGLMWQLVQFLIPLATNASRIDLWTLIHDLLLFERSVVSLKRVYHLAEAFPPERPPIELLLQRILNLSRHQILCTCPSPSESTGACEMLSKLILKTIQQLNHPMQLKAFEAVVIQYVATLCTRAVQDSCGMDWNWTSESVVTSTSKLLQNSRLCLIKTILETLGTGYVLIMKQPTRLGRSLVFFANEMFRLLGRTAEERDAVVKGYPSTVYYVFRGLSKIGMDLLNAKRRIPSILSNILSLLPKLDAEYLKAGLETLLHLSKHLEHADKMEIIGTLFENLLNQTKQMDLLMDIVANILPPPFPAVVLVDEFDDAIIRSYLSTLAQEKQTDLTELSDKVEKYLRVPLQRLASTHPVVVKNLSAVFVLTNSWRNRLTHFSSNLSAQILAGIVVYGGEKTTQEVLRSFGTMKLLQAWLLLSFLSKEDDTWREFTSILRVLFHRTRCPYPNHVDKDIVGCWDTLSESCDRETHFRALCDHFAIVYPSLTRPDLSMFINKTINRETGVFLCISERIHKTLRELSVALEESGENSIRLTSDVLETAVGYHDIKVGRARVLHPLIRFLKHVYDCIVILFTTCGPLATNATIFTRFMTEFFPITTQVVHSTAANIWYGYDETKGRAAQRGLSHQQLIHATYNQAARATKALRCDPVVESIREVVQVTKYPDLIRWFAHTADTYQLYNDTGWKRSYLRLLLLNSFDPDGPLGAATYYPRSNPLRQRYLHALACGFCCTYTCQACVVGQSNNNLGAERIKVLRQYVLADGLKEFIATCDPIAVISFVVEIVKHYSALETPDVIKVTTDELRPVLKDLETRFFTRLEWKSKSSIGYLLHIELCRLGIALLESGNMHDLFLELLHLRCQILYVRLTTGDPTIAVQVQNRWDQLVGLSSDTTDTTLDATVQADRAEMDLVREIQRFFTALTKRS